MISLFDALIQLVIAFFATVSFAVLFQVPKNQYLWSGITGSLGWLCYLLVNQGYGSVVIASFAATLVLTALSRFFAVWRRTPITIFLICGIFPLVPGAGIYYTAYYFIMGDNAMAAVKGTETLKIAVAITLGIVLILSLTQKIFRLGLSKDRF